MNSATGQLRQKVLGGAEAMFCGPVTAMNGDAVAKTN